MIKATSSANESSYRPPEFNDDEFKRWSLRVTLKLLNLPPGSPDNAMKRILVAEGVPSPEWLNALMFIVAMARETQSASGARNDV